MDRKVEIEVLQKHGDYVREIVAHINDTLAQLAPSSAEEPNAPDAATAELLDQVAELLIRLAGEVGTFDRRLLVFLKDFKASLGAS